jgi:hypothetical protein
MNLKGREYRIRKVWCDKHHFNDHWVFFIKRDYERKDKAMIPFVMYAKICFLCYEEDYRLKENQANALGVKFDTNRYAFDSVIEQATENDFQALWNVKFY